jgi:hypothetical protein
LWTGCRGSVRLNATCEPCSEKYWYFRPHGVWTLFVSCLLAVALALFELTEGRKKSGFISSSDVNLRRLTPRRRRWGGEHGRSRHRTGKWVGTAGMPSRFSGQYVARHDTRIDGIVSAASKAARMPNRRSPAR